ncbi:substrate-binding domain-containing protein [Methylobacterium sp. SI9]|uniref:substrate-binding domain-containing protein n=1 Tax=Methylobacterium guangdongense TaxID=3138811 RepID=UPI00313E5A8C
MPPVRSRETRQPEQGGPASGERRGAQAEGVGHARSTALAGTLQFVGPAEYLSARVGPALAPLVGEGLRLRIQTGNRARIYAALDQGQADLAVTASKPDSRSLGFAELDRERLTLVAAPDLAARAKGRTVSAGLLRDLPCLAYDEELALIGAFFVAVFGVPAALRPAATAPDLRILLGMAEAGMGWTILPDYLCAGALAAGRLAELPTDRAGPVNTLYLAWTRASLREARTVHVRDMLLQRFQTA